MLAKQQVSGCCILTPGPPPIVHCQKEAAAQLGPASLYEQVHMRSRKYITDRTSNFRALEILTLTFTLCRLFGGHDRSEDVSC